MKKLLLALLALGLCAGHVEAGCKPCGSCKRCEAPRKKDKKQKSKKAAKVEVIEDDADVE